MRDTSASDRHNHLDDDRLLALARDEGAASELAHVRACATCARALEETRVVLARLGELRQLTEPPAWLHARALAAIRRRREAGSRFSGFLSCVFDSLLSPRPAHVRGPAGPGRQVLLRDDAIELDLHLVARSEEGPGRLTGQVLPWAPRAGAAPAGELLATDELAEIEVEIRGDDGARVATRTDRFGIFSASADWRLPLVVAVRVGDRVHEAFVPADRA